MNGDIFLQWLSNEAQRSTEYHDHKETMAWVATVFYITGALVISYQLRGFGDCAKGLGLVFLFGLLVVTILFLVFQFYNRKLAAERVDEILTIAFYQMSQDSKVSSLVNNLKKKYDINENGIPIKKKHGPFEEEILTYISVIIAFSASIFILFCL